MSYEATEELFDNIMKGLSDDYGETYETSDVEDSADNNIVSLKGEEKSKENYLKNSIKPDDSEPLVIETNLSKVTSAESSKGNLSENPKVSEVNEISRSQENGALEISVYKKSSAEMEPEIKCNKVVTPVSNSNKEELGVPLDPMDNEIFDSIETVTVDINQSTQDDEVTSCSTVEVSDEVVEMISLSSQENILHKASENPTDKTNKSENTAEKNIIDVTVHQNVNSKENSSQNTDIDKEKNLKYIRSLKIFSNLLKDIKSSVEDSVISSTSKTSLESLNVTNYTCQGLLVKYLILRFYFQHLSRETSKILYNCKKCAKKIIFTNPCLFKIHLKTHGDSVENVQLEESNLTVNVPSILDFKSKYVLEFGPDAMEKSLGCNDTTDIIKLNKCPLCKLNVPSMVEHLLYRPDYEEIYRCGKCEFVFSSKCSFNMHMRYHKNLKPYSCPECGTTFITQARLLYHLNLECFHLRRSVMRRCPCILCKVILPSKEAFEDHLLLSHRTVIYKCLHCPRTFKYISDLESHNLVAHNEVKAKVIVYDKCEVCPSDERRVFPHIEFNQHLLKHVLDKRCIFYAFKCRKCNFSTQNPFYFQKHIQEQKACRNVEEAHFKRLYPDFLIHPVKRKCPEFNCEILCKKIRSIYSVKKIIGNSTDNIKENDKDVNETITTEKEQRVQNNGNIICLLCNTRFNNSEDVRVHIVDYHKCDEYHKYVQITLSLKEVPKKITGNNENVTDRKIISTNNEILNKEGICLNCPSCDYVADSKEDFQNHVVVHREDGAYQCLECGECFVCKNPLEIHLVSVHSIKDTSTYISSHYVHNSLPKPCDTSEELQPNQCSVCFDVFPDDKALQLHFRSHGMAFLRQSFAKKITT